MARNSAICQLIDCLGLHGRLDPALVRQFASLGIDLERAIRCLESKCRRGNDEGRRRGVGDPDDRAAVDLDRLVELVADRIKRS